MVNWQINIYTPSYYLQMVNFKDRYNKGLFEPFLYTYSLCYTDGWIKFVERQISYFYKIFVYLFVFIK